MSDPKQQSTIIKDENHDYNYEYYETLSRMSSPNTNKDIDPDLSNMNLNISYPRDPYYDYFVKLNRINLDEEFKKDIENNQGFIISEPTSINKTLVEENSIFSEKFGRSLNSPSPYTHRYKCRCGHIQGAFFSVPDDANFVCPICKSEVKRVGDNFRYFGWIVLKDDYCVIHPAMYWLLTSLIGKDNLESIIEPSAELLSNGQPASAYDKRILRKKNARKYKKRGKIDETYAGIGMLGLRDKIQEVLDYFVKKKPAKKSVYNEIMANKDKIFIHAIPVYTTQLRIAKVENKRFTFEKTNADFNMLAKLAATINRDHLSVYRNYKYQNQILWDMQNKFNDLTTEILNILSDKKGTVRTTLTGRTAYTSRAVIVPDSTLSVDEVRLPYYGLVLLMEQILINIIQSSYNITYAAAYKIWYYATLNVDQRVLDIINNLIKMDKVHVLINRNPSINIFSIIWKRVISCDTDSMVISLDPYILRFMAADQTRYFWD